MNIELIKAIWAAGFRVGRDNGSDEACAYEHGTFSQKPQDPVKAWDEDVQWRINTDTSQHIDVDNPKHWEEIG